MPSAAPTTNGNGNKMNGNGRASSGNNGSNGKPAESKPYAAPVPQASSTSSLPILTPSFKPAASALTSQLATSTDDKASTNAKASSPSPEAAAPVTNNTRPRPSKVSIPMDISSPSQKSKAADGPKVFEAGDSVLCVASFDGQPHPAKVIERSSPRGHAAQTTYYIHYTEFNKRLDEWVPQSRLEEAPAGSLPMSLTLSPHPTGVISLSSTPVGYVAGEGTPGSSERKITRNLKRRYDEIHNVEKPVEELAPIDQTLEKEHEELTKLKNIQTLITGRWEMDTWYYAPYPGEYGNCSTLYVCEFCLKYMRKESVYRRHCGRCKHRKPPGKEIYTDTGGDTVEHVSIAGRQQRHASSASKAPQPKTQAISVFEVDGQEHKMYCQNLCLMAKMFLDHKTLFFDVDLFLFYIVTERDEHGYHVVGYFSKEKKCAEDYCLACILTLPPYQRKGYGRFLISLAYEISKKEGKIGTPERPLSDLGAVSFRSYWTRELLNVLREERNLSIKQIGALTSIRSEDIIATLQSLSLLKYWKGQYIINVTPKIVEEHMRSLGPAVRPGQATMKPRLLNWQPPVAPVV